MTDGIRPAQAVREPSAVAYWVNTARSTPRQAAGRVCYRHTDTQVHGGSRTTGPMARPLTGRCTVARSGSSSASRPEREGMGAAEAAQQGRKHICCLNGEADFLALLAELFSDERYNVTTTNYVAETFEMINTLQADLLIVDLVTGVHAGWALLEQLTREAATQGIPVIVTSTDQRILDEVHANPARYGVHQQLVKPFDIDTILGFVNDAIGPA